MKCIVLMVYDQLSKSSLLSFTMKSDIGTEKRDEWDVFTVYKN